MTVTHNKISRRNDMQFIPHNYQKYTIDFTIEDRKSVV